MIGVSVDSTEQLTTHLTLALVVISFPILVLLLCGKNHERFDDDSDHESAATREKRRESKRKLREERRRMKEGLKKGEYRPADHNETINEVVSNWGVAHEENAAAPADGAPQKDERNYFDPPAANKYVCIDISSLYCGSIPYRSAESKNAKHAKGKRRRSKPQNFRPANDNETVNEVASNWGAAHPSSVELVHLLCRTLLQPYCITILMSEQGNYVSRNFLECDFQKAQN
ncbi:hypothetical protein DICVIV_08500 [Dictyocaulus viviparus]|uniref:Uncharacterized protein n=1 Tax=Dictyocaulus viviparus TaxID=29172 RepID=A0A0D8XSV4_DICVI|nr:hypothetical protein DICVIV_08500 [Dictyocaulus viviparus]